MAQRLSPAGGEHASVSVPSTRVVGTGVLRPRARLLRTLGSELISSDTVAVTELVKNSYDADATRVLIRFIGPLEVGAGGIEIIDNGHGMSLETITTAWLEPATPYRKRSPRTERRQRRVLGEKGIGRFAASRLADTLEVVTRRADSETEVRALFDWRQFDDDQKFLDEIVLSWEQRPPLEIHPSGVISSLWGPGDSPQPCELSHGTILRMKNLRSRWTEDQLKVLRQQLSRLISPFFGPVLSTTGDEFQIRLTLPDPYLHLCDVIEPPEIIKKPHYRIAGNIDGQGGYELSLTLKGRDDGECLRGTFVVGNGRVPECGPFYVELRVWDREDKDLQQLASQLGCTVRDIREDLDAAAGVSIYRDGFRVLPYGEPHNDWLRLDLRSRLAPTKRLANNQVVGYVLISADGNPLLKDQSNREGLMEGTALEDLKELIIKVLNEVEVFRYKVRPRQPKPQKGIFSGFNLNDVIQQLTDHGYSRESAVVQRVADKERDLRNRIRHVQEVLARYRRLATLGQLIDGVLHEGLTSIGIIRNEVDLALLDMRSDRSDLAVRTLPHLTAISGQLEALSTFFRRLEPFGGRRRGRPNTVVMEEVIQDAFDVLDGEIRKLGVRVTSPPTSTSVSVDPVEIQEVILNLLTNSLYWLRQVPRERREIRVQVFRTGTGEVQILFSDSGPGVSPQVRDFIFEPYFSTKPDGVGLGLSIAGEIVKDYYDGELELIDGGPLPGATFRVTLRRRV